MQWIERYKLQKTYAGIKKKNRKNTLFENFSETVNSYTVIKKIKGTGYSVIGSVSPERISIHEERHHKIFYSILSIINNQIRYNIDCILYYYLKIRLVLLFLVFLLCILVAVKIASFITKPVLMLRDAVKEVGKGNFNSSIKEAGSVEVVDLARAFNALGHNLQKYMADLEKSIISRKKIQDEVQIAAEIQRSTAPKFTPEFKRPEFSLSVALEPASTGAGDFYDFFYIGEDRIALVIADVSGKGIAAAFFMTMARTILRNNCKNEASPSDAMNKTNKILAADNEKCMFVTVFLAYYDIKTGSIVYANAGHHEAITVDKNKEFTFFGSLNNPILAVYDDTEYSESTYNLAKGETLILYTDGITEAVFNEEPFGEDRLIEFIKNNIDLSTDQLCTAIVKSVREFEKGIPFDDITLVIFKRN